MTKDTKILFLSAAAGITFMLGVLTGDYFGQKKGYSAGACDAYCEYSTQIDSLSAEYRQAIDNYHSHIADINSVGLKPVRRRYSPACHVEEQKDLARHTIILNDSLIREFYEASKKAALEAREATKHLRPQ